MTQTHKVITVFLLQRADSTIPNRRSDNTEVWVGDDSNNFSPSFTQVISGMYGSGFH